MLLVVALGVIVTMLFFTSQWRATREHDTRSIQDFYHNTVNAMDASRRGSGGAQIVMNGKAGTQVNPQAKDKDGDGTVGADDVQESEQMAERLRAAEQKAKDSANAKAPLKPDSPGKVVGVGSSAGGQGKKGKTTTSEASREDETAEEHEVEVTLNEILKRSPSEFPVLSLADTEDPID
jgi:hypothetical protein